MIAYTAVLEVRTDLRGDAVARALADYGATVYREPYGYLEVVLRVPADSVRQATCTALAVVKEATGGPVVAIEVLPAEPSVPMDEVPMGGVPGAPHEEQAPADATPVDVRAEVRRHLRVLSTCR